MIFLSGLNPGLSVVPRKLRDNELCEVAIKAKMLIPEMRFICNPTFDSFLY